MNDLERELEQALHRVLDPISARQIPARRALARRSRSGAVMGGAVAAFSVKALAGAAAAAAAVMVAGVATTGSLSPSAWERHAADTVSTLSNQHSAAATPASLQHAPETGGGGNANANGGGSASPAGQPPAAKSDGGSDQVGTEPSDPVGTHPPVKISPFP